MDTIEIRPCTPEDLPHLQVLMEELARWAQAQGGFSLKRMREQLQLMDGSPDTYSNWVALRDDRVVGFLSALFYVSFLHRGGTAQINELVVHPACQRQGIGRRLIGRVREEALRRGMDELEVGTEKENSGAREFYRSCGFPLEYILFGQELR